MSIKRDIEFLFEVGSMRNMPRGWRQHLGVDCASNMDHTMRVVFLALILSRMEKGLNEDKVLKMALIHDVAETRTSDLSYIQKVYVKEDEVSAARDLFASTSLTDLNDSLLKEYKERKTKESKVVKDADNLDIDLELKELEDRGSKLPKKWKVVRKMVRDKKLYTKSAKKFWDEIQKSDPDSWHMLANKWHKLPNAGK